MAELLLSSGATNFFTLVSTTQIIFSDIFRLSSEDGGVQVRYNPPELLADYLRSKQEEGRGAGRDEGRGTGRGRRESVRSEASSGPSSEAATEAAEETAEDIIFTLFGPRVWEHEGELHLTSCL